MIMFEPAPATTWVDFLIYGTVIVVAIAAIQVALIYFVFAIRGYINRRRHRARVRRIVADHEARLAATRTAWGHR